MMRRALVLLGMFMALGVSACVPPHYSVAVTSTPSRVTFAQRHHDQRRNDYLVDCQLMADGSYANCAIIELVTPR